VIPYGTGVPVAVRQITCELLGLYPYTLLLLLTVRLNQFKFLGTITNLLISAATGIRWPVTSPLSCGTTLPPPEESKGKRDDSLNFSTALLPRP